MRAVPFLGLLQLAFITKKIGAKEMNSKLFKQIPEHEKSTCPHCKQRKANWLFFYDRGQWNFNLCDQCGTSKEVKEYIRKHK